MVVNVTQRSDNVLALHYKADTTGSSGYVPDDFFDSARVAKPFVPLPQSKSKLLKPATPAPGVPTAPSSNTTAPQGPASARAPTPAAPVAVIPSGKKARSKARSKANKTAWKPLSLASSSEFPSLRKAMPRPLGPSHKERLLAEERQINIRQMAEWRYNLSTAHASTPPVPWQFPFEERLLAHARDLRDGFVAPDTSAGFRDGPSNESVPASNTTVFVGGLPGDASAEVLRLVFGVWGDIEICNIPKSGRGCAFITYFERQAAEDALYFMQGFPLYDSKLRPAWGHDNRLGKTQKTRTAFSISENANFLAEYLDLSDIQKQKLKRFCEEADGEDFELFKRVHTMPVSSSSSWSERPISVDRYANYPYGPYRDSPDIFQSLDEDESSTLPALSSPSSTSTSIVALTAQDRAMYRSRTPSAPHDASCPRFPPATKLEDDKLFAPFVGSHSSVMSAAADAGGGAFGWSSSGTIPYYAGSFSPPAQQQRKTSTTAVETLREGRRLSAEEKAALAWKDCGCPDPTEILGHR